MNNNEKYYITVDGVSCEVSKEVYDFYRQAERHERYLVERDKAHNVLVLDVAEIERMETSDAPNGLVTSVQSQEEQMIAQELHAILRKCIDLLPKGEQNLIQAIFFDGETEAAYAKKLGISQPAVHKQRDKILAKLRILMKKIGGFSDLVINLL